MRGGRTPAASKRQRAAGRPVSKPHDPDEREADRAAEIVAHGGSVTGWSFSAVPASAPAPVQRQEVVKEKTDEEKKNEALKKTGEAVLATPEGQAVKARVLADPLVKSVTDAVTSTPGMIVTGAAAAGGVAALAATGKALPFQPPEIPLDKITPGLSAKVTYEGPVNAPTFVGLTVTYKEQGPKGKAKPKPDPIAADIARLKAQQEMFRPESEKLAARRQEDEAVAAWVASQQLPGARPGFTIPLTTPPAAKKDEAPVQRAVASASEAPAYADVDAALETPGRPLDPSTRRSMEARFSYDFSRVRVHDDARSASAAAGTNATAFTVGDDIVFGTGRYDPATSLGMRLIAHELAHVVQHTRVRRGGPPISRQAPAQPAVRSAPTPFTDQELRAYLELVRRTRGIEGGADSPRKARELIDRFRAGAPAFAILTIPDRVLVIQEMLQGSRSADTETALLGLFTEAIPEERLSMIWSVGEDRIRAILSQPNLVRFDELIRTSVDEAIIGLLRAWTVAEVLRILDRHGDAHVIDDLLALGYKVMSFETAFDRWQYDDGRREERELTGLGGNTDRAAKVIRLRASLDAEAAASALFHEIRHALSPDATTDDEYLEDEISARVSEEEFRIRHGMGPTHPSFRRADGTVDDDAIRRTIRGSSHYNPTGRRRIGRRYVGQRVVGGWRPPKGAGPRP